MTTRQAAAQGRHVLDIALAPYRLHAGPPPRRGWIRAIRDALGMTAAQLGARMGVSQPTVQRLERSEVDGVIQMSSLRRAAEAMDCELVYVLLPRRPLGEAYEARARRFASRELDAARHSMALEAQGVDDAEADARLRRFIEEELDPRELWAPDPRPPGP